MFASYYITSNTINYYSLIKPGIKLYKSNLQKTLAISFSVYPNYMIVTNDNLKDPKICDIQFCLSVNLN